MKHKGITIFPCPELSGSTHAYQSNDEIYVSEAVYTLLLDPECKEIVMRQIKVRDLQTLLEEGFRKFERVRKKRSS